VHVRVVVGMRAPPFSSETRTSPPKQKTSERSGGGVKPLESYNWRDWILLGVLFHGQLTLISISSRGLGLSLRRRNLGEMEKLSTETARLVSVLVLDQIMVKDLRKR
jgi:hypothetical protein